MSSVFVWEGINSSTQNQLDVVKVLGRAAKGLRIRVPTGRSGTVKLRFNSLQKVIKFNETGLDTTIETWLPVSGNLRPSITLAAGEGCGEGTSFYPSLNIESIECELFDPADGDSNSLDGFANVEVW